MMDSGNFHHACPLHRLSNFADLALLSLPTAAEE